MRRTPIKRQTQTARSTVAGSIISLAHPLANLLIFFNFFKDLRSEYIVCDIAVLLRSIRIDLTLTLAKDKSSK